MNTTSNAVVVDSETTSNSIDNKGSNDSNVQCSPPQQCQ